VNYLTLTQRVHLILRIGDETPGTQPTSAAGQTGVLSEMLQWVTASHDDICRLHTDWLFMRGTGSFTLPQGAQTLSLAAMRVAQPTLGKPLPFVADNGAFIGITGEGAEQTCEYVPYGHWIGTYDLAPIATGFPSFFTITPDGGLAFDTVTDRAYTLRFQFNKAVVPLAADADAPMFDDSYHMAIVWWAILNYYCASRDGTRELTQKADAELRRELTKLRNEQLPDFLLG
jgi:hypothetical protein